jgi:hypothetical protein
MGYSIDCLAALMMPHPRRTPHSIFIMRGIDSLFAEKFDTNPRYHRPAAGIARRLSYRGLVDSRNSSIVYMIYPNKPHCIVECMNAHFGRLFTCHSPL